MPLPFAGAAIGLGIGLVKKLAAPAIAKVGQAIIKRPVATAVVTTIAGATSGRVGQPSRPALPAPPPYAGGQGPIPVPPSQGGWIPGPIERGAQMIVPGGRTGREYMPYEGTERDKIGRPIAVHPDVTQRWKAPRGYVMVRGPNDEPIAMLKGVARSLGLWKPRPKPPVSGWDLRAITRASGAKKRVKSLAGKVGLATKAKGR